MLSQKIDALIFLNELHAMNAWRENKLQLTDATLLLTINSRPEMSKTDYVEIFYSARAATKSKLDRPFERLLDAGLIEQIENPGACTQSGAGRRYYRIATDGAFLLKRCVR